MVKCLLEMDNLNANYIRVFDKKNLLKYLRKSNYTEVADIFESKCIDGRIFSELTDLNLFQWKLTLKQKKLILDCKKEIFGLQAQQKAQRPIESKKPLLKSAQFSNISQKLEVALKPSNAHGKSAEVPAGIARPISRFSINNQNKETLNVYLDMAQNLPKYQQTENAEEIEDYEVPTGFKPPLKFHFSENDTEDVNYEMLKPPEKPPKAVDKNNLRFHRTALSIPSKPIPILPSKASTDTLTTQPIRKCPMLPQAPLADYENVYEAEPVHEHFHKVPPIVKPRHFPQTFNTRPLPEPPKLDIDFEPSHLAMAKLILEDKEADTNEEFNPNDCRYYRNTDQKGAINLLKQIPNLDDGAFLFRRSEKYCLVITMYNKGAFHKIGVHRDKGFFYCKTEDNNTPDRFSSLEDFVRHYKTHPLTIKSHGSLVRIYLKELLPDHIF